MEGSGNPTQPPYPVLLKLERTGDWDALVQYLNDAIEQTNRNTRAIYTLTSWLVDAQSGLGAQDYKGILEILRAER